MQLLFTTIMTQTQSFLKEFPDPTDEELKITQIFEHQKRLITLCFICLLGQRREFVARMVTHVN
jgi:hypothetical protein